MYPYLTVGVAHTSSQPSQTDASLKQEQSPNNNPIENLQPQEQHIENQKCNADEEGTCSISKQQTSLKVDDRLLEVAAKHKINSTLIERLQLLQNFDIVVVCADSASMKTRLGDMKCSRWDELRLIVEVVIEIGKVFNPNGVDVYFLDRPPLFDVSDLGRLDQIFVEEPHDSKTLAAVLRKVFKSYDNERDHDKKMLVLVATDAEPTDDEGNSDVATLAHVIQNERQSDKIYVSFLACTDNESSVVYVEQFDNIMENVSVTDDYLTERNFEHHNHGPHYPFSFGDYIAKALLNAVETKVHNSNGTKDENEMNGKIEKLQV